MWALCPLLARYSASSLAVFRQLPPRYFASSLAAWSACRSSSSVYPNRKADITRSAVTAPPQTVPAVDQSFRGFGRCDGWRADDGGTGEFPTPPPFKPHPALLPTASAVVASAAAADAGRAGVGTCGQGDMLQRVAPEGEPTRRGDGARGAGGAKADQPSRGLPTGFLE
jgi:hypothetical protein